MTTTRPDAFEPIGAGTTTAFVDASAIVALFNPRDDYHENASKFHEYLRSGALPYRGLYTNDYVLDEATTHLRRRVGHEQANYALATLRKSDLYDVSLVMRRAFDGGVRRFRDYDDQTLSFTDCVIGAHLSQLGLDHLLTYDSDFEVFDVTTLSHYVA